MKIATFINDHNDLADFQEKGTICLFDQVSGVWTKQKEIVLDLSQVKSISEVKVLLKQTALQLDGCKVFLVQKLKGATHVFLEELGFRIWKSEGTLIEQLDNVALKDTETTTALAQSLGRIKEYQASSGCGSGGCGSRKSRHESLADNADHPIPKPLCIDNAGGGHYRIDLAKVLKDDPGLNSKDILIPFLEEAAFQKLEILCDHVPRWFDQTLVQLNLKAESQYSDAAGRQVKVIVVPRN